MYPLLPIVMALGLAANFVGIFTWCYTLYKGIPFVGETLTDRERQPISNSERQRLRSIAKIGIGLVLMGHMVMVVSFWILASHVYGV